MKLVSFQSLEALKDLVNKGYLECNQKYINLKKAGSIYAWVVEKMSERISNSTDASYPVWAWVRCYNGICPPRHKGKPVGV